MAEPRIRLVVLFGGRSAEHDVSCTSAVSVLGAVDPARYDVVPVGITKDGTWVAAEEAARALASGGAQALPARLSATGPTLEPLDVVAVPAASSDITVVLPLLHGPFGEDGTVQGLLELAGVPYVGSGVLGSALAMDKAAAKQVLSVAGLPQPKWLAVRDWDVDGAFAARVEAELGWPVFVKPANMGSSVGVSRVGGRDGFDDAVALALAYDEWVVVEEAITGREIECAVLGDRTPEASLPGEVKPGNAFYDYEDKYVTDGAELCIPADLPPDVVAEVQRQAIAAFQALRCEGMARVDFFYEEGGRGLLVSEVNTIPGFTPISMYPKLWEASGVPYPELIDRLVALAVDRHERRRGRLGRPRG